MSSFLELCQEYVNEVGITDSEPTAVTGQVPRIQRAIRDIQQADLAVQRLYHDWNFLHTQFSTNTIIGTAAYSAPSDLGVWDNTSFWLNYSLSTHSQLIIKDYKSWRNSYGPGVQTNALPGFVIVKPDKSLVLSSPPDAVYALTADYWKNPVKMTANTDTSQIPVKFERIIILRAKLFYAAQEDAPEIRQDTLAEYQDLLSQLTSAELPGQQNRMMSEGEAESVGTHDDGYRFGNYFEGNY